MQKAGLVVALGMALACTGVPTSALALPASPAADATTSASRILVAGVKPGSPAVQKIVDTAFQKVAAQAGYPDTLSDAQWQQVVARVNVALQQAGYAQARAYLPDQMAGFTVHGSHVLPTVPERETAAAQAQRITVRGFVLRGVGNHPDAGITEAGMNQFAAAQLEKLGGGGTGPARLTFDQLQDVADAITQRYRKAGFIVATAFVPQQTIGADEKVRIKVLEGRIGRIKVKGAKHYRAGVIAAPARKLQGKVLRKRDVDTALLYDRDLPGVSVSSTFQPGEKTGQTDLVMLAREAKHPFAFHLGANNYGTRATGRYRLSAGVDWNAPLGIGDQLAVGVNYSLDPHHNTFGSLKYTIPTVKVRGLSGLLGANRSELRLNGGDFAGLGIRGPTSRYFAGMQWKFVNHRDLSMTGSLEYIDEHSQLKTLGMSLSDERFDIAQLALSLQHTARATHGLDRLSVAVRRSLRDRSRQPDLVSPNHADKFTVATLAYTRIQFLSKTQQLFFKLDGQYTRDVLVPMEQFAIGGPDSVRAYPIADALSDRGVRAALEYHVDAPGFADKPSPFHGEPWRQLLTLEAFFDVARGYSADTGLAGDQGGTGTYRGVGLGFIFHLPHWHQLLFRLDGAVPVGSLPNRDQHGIRIYGRFGLTF